MRKETLRSDRRQHTLPAPRLRGIFGSLLLTRTQACVTLQGGQLSPINLIVEERFHRAAPGGMGGTKAAGNYSPVRLSSATLSCLPSRLRCACATAHLT